MSYDGCKRCIPAVSCVYWYCMYYVFIIVPIKNTDYRLQITTNLILI
jgi:hypothetical protein